MKKKIIVGIAVCATLVIVIVGIVYGIKIYQREQDPFWQLAKKLYNVESALQEIDESWELQSLTQVTPYCYQDPDGDTITYYCCITTYVAMSLPSILGSTKLHWNRWWKWMRLKTAVTVKLTDWKRSWENLMDRLICAGRFLPSIAV
jgi:hypothetical protein